MPPPKHMRIIALPLTRQTRTLQPLVYYHAQMPPRPSSAGQPSLVTQARERAVQTWFGFGKSPQNTWKYRLYAFGQRIYRRVDFEELALQSVEPALGPKVLGNTSASTSNPPADESAPAKQEHSIPLLHPTIVGPSSPIEHLRMLVSHRAPVHYRNMWIFIVWLPICAPFAFVPVIPNIPFFYCAWRAWSHWRAYRAATYLSTLLSSSLIKPSASVTLDDLYASFPSPNPTNPNLLLDDAGVEKVLSAFGLPKESGTEIMIAIRQAQSRLEAEAEKEAKSDGHKAKIEPPGPEKQGKPNELKKKEKTS